MLVRPHERSTTKTRLKNSLSPLRHFTEHLVGVFGKLPWKNNLDHKYPRLSIRWLNSTPGKSPAIITLKPMQIDEPVHYSSKTIQQLERPTPYTSGGA
jgi:hypothetical protein